MVASTIALNDAASTAASDQNTDTEQGPGGQDDDEDSVKGALSTSPIAAVADQNRQGTQLAEGEPGADAAVTVAKVSPAGDGASSLAVE